ncbi:MAG: DUF6600 domain-containing protein [Verrucomicrobiota bacterium]
MIELSLTWKMIPWMILALQPFTERPDIDFDNVIAALEEQGTWKTNDQDTYYFVPNESMSDYIPPFRKGQWIYTDYGWTWKGEFPASWAIEHYGYWTRQVDEEKRWVWVPNGTWLPSTVEWLVSGEYVGWRASKLDRFGNPTERENIRYGDATEWSFIPIEKLKSSIVPEDFAPQSQVEDLMAEAVPVDHIYKTYREIARPGPSPTILTGDPEELPLIPVTLSLPDLRFKPKNKTPQQYFSYRPKFYQDDAGIMRRVHLFLNPRQTPDEEKLKKMFGETEEQKKKKLEMIERFERSQEREEKHWESLYAD